jgi:hypothetical protein
MAGPVGLAAVPNRWSPPALPFKIWHTPCFFALRGAMPPGGLTRCTAGKRLLSHEQVFRIGGLARLSVVSCMSQAPLESSACKEAMGRHGNLTVPSSINHSITDRLLAEGEV